jgi:hypothetical protein
LGKGKGQRGETADHRTTAEAEQINERKDPQQQSWTQGRMLR